MALTPSTKPSGRLGSRKSKTGCLTCKSRRVRCGEERPFCKRCIVAGFRCRGYQDPFVPTTPGRWASATQESRLESTIPSRSPSPIPINQDELRSFELCRTQLIPHLGGAIEFGFWESLVLQMSYSEPAVRQSLVALGSMFEQSRASQFRSMDLNTATLRSYNNALAVTSRRTEAPDSELVALITCVLFLCIEFMQGNKQRALDLLKHGQTVLRKHLQEQSQSRPSTTLINDTITPLYERLASLSALFGQLLPPLRTTGPKATETSELAGKSFSSLREASNILYPLCLEGNKFIKRTRGHETSSLGPESQKGDVWVSEFGESRQHTEETSQAPERTQEHLMVWRFEQAALLSALDRWRSMLMENTHANYVATVRDQQLERILLMWHATAVARVKSALHTSESCFNDYLPQFHAIVESAEQFQEITASHPGVSEFTFEMGVLPPLFFTALKCRFPDLRQRAIEAMRRGSRKEGLWDREELLAVSKRVVDLEHGESLDLSSSMVPVQPQVFDVRVGHTPVQDNVHVTLLLIEDEPERGWRVSEALLQLHEGS